MVFRLGYLKNDDGWNLKKIITFLLQKFYINQTLKRHEGGIFLFLTLIMAHCKFLFLSWKRWRSTWEPRSYGLISLLFYMYKCICTDIFYKLNTVNQIIFMDTFFTFKSFYSTSRWFIFAIFWLCWCIYIRKDP